MKRILVLFLCILFLSGCHAPTHADSTDPIPVVPNNTENTSVDHIQILTVSVPISTEHFYADDGTEIFTYFLTAQNCDKDFTDDAQTTYVGMVNPNMHLGTWRRYQQKAME